MTLPGEYPSIRYLAAKKGVDDRALNGHVLRQLTTDLADFGDHPVEILEIGAGIGTMLERLAGRGMLRNARYEAVDLAPEHIAEAVRRVPLWAADHGFSPAADPDPACTFRLERDGSCISCRFEAIDLRRFLEREQGRRKRDLVIAHAFLDLVDLDAVLPGLISLTRPGGLLSLTMNFDGLTVLEPAVDPTLDGEILALYHESMDSRVVDGKPSGESRTGRHLLTRLRELGVEILAAGSSDWVVFPKGGGYPGDEAYFCHFIVNVIDLSLKGHPRLDPERFARWIAIRHSQVERCELVLIAHQIDLLGCTGDRSVLHQRRVHLSSPPPAVRRRRD